MNVDKRRIKIPHADLMPIECDNCGSRRFMETYELWRTEHGFKLHRRSCQHACTTCGRLLKIQALTRPGG